jgi:hypothetical protein
MINSAAEEVTKLQQMWTESYARGDAAFLERHLSDDYIDTFPDGTVLDRSGEIESGEINVRIYGEAAVITGRSTIRAKLKGQDVSG